MNELVVVEKLNLPALFASGGSDPLLKKIKKEVMDFVPDISTPTGRKDIASLAHKVARSKTLLDGLGKDLVAEIKAKAGVIDSERKKIRDELDQLKEDVRHPLTQWEDAEEVRVENIKDRIEAINSFADTTDSIPWGHNLSTSTGLTDALTELKGLEINDFFAEFVNVAAMAKDKAVMFLEAKLIVVKNEEKEQAERERIGKERVAKEQKEREEQIAKGAAEAAKEQAEEKAKREAEEKERIVIEEAEKKERLAKEALEKAERETLEAKLAKEQAEREKKEAAEHAERDKRIAVEAEKERIRQEQYKKEQEAEKREANKRHRNKIVGEIRDDMKQFKSQHAVIDAIIDGKIRHIKVQF